MKVYLGADHKGYELKNVVREHLQHRGIDIEDKGALTLEPGDDYPQYAYSVVTEVLGEEKDGRGILICGSGQGMAMAANKVHGIRAALAWNLDECRAARHDDDANVLVLPSDTIDEQAALAMVDAFLNQPFSGEERHRRRLDQIEQLYG